jgi:hypothetical protein
MGELNMALNFLIGDACKIHVEKLKEKTVCES